MSSIFGKGSPVRSPPCTGPGMGHHKANMSLPAAQDNHDPNLEATRDNSPTSVFVNLEPVREEQVQNAVKFLSHPRVRGSSVIYRRSFLERKGLTSEEIDEAFHRVPDPYPTVSTTQPVAANEDEKVKSLSTTQSLSASALQSNTLSKRGHFSHFHWTHAIMAIGMLAASGVSTVLLLKHTVIPRFKSWIHKVIMEEEDKKGAVKGRPSLAEEAAVAAKAAAAAATDVARSSQEMLASKTEEKRFFEELTNLLNYQVREMKSMSSALQKLEERSLSLPALVEPSITPHPKSYVDIMAMIQRGEKPSNIRDINNQPSNPYQPVPNLRVGPLPKPWEIGQNQNISRNFLQSQGSGDGLNYEYQINLTNGDSSTPWWQRKNARITEIKAENEQKFEYTAAPTEGRPVQQSWVPPQPPSVAMAEAVAGLLPSINQRSFCFRKKADDDELMARSSEISDDLQRITKISESGGLTEINDSSFGNS